MFPTITQRLMMLVGLLLVVWPAVWAGELASGAAVSLAAGRWSAGVTLMVMVLGLLPAVGAGLVLSATGNVLSGVWLVGAAAVAMGVSGGVSGGGGMDAVVRASPTAGTMTWLALESGVWGLAVMGLWLGLKAVRPGLRRWLVRRVGERWVTPKPGGMGESGWASLRAMGSALVTAGVGGGLVWLALRSSGSGQVVAAGVVGLTVGGLAGRLAFPGGHALLSLLSPAGLGLAGFWLAGQGLTGLSEQEVLAMWYGGEWVPIARGLPVVLVGAGVVGAAMGVGLGQAVERAVERAKRAGE